MKVCSKYLTLNFLKSQTSLIVAKIRAKWCLATLKGVYIWVSSAIGKQMNFSKSIRAAVRPYWPPTPSLIPQSALFWKSFVNFILSSRRLSYSCVSQMSKLFTINIWQRSGLSKPHSEYKSNINRNKNIEKHSENCNINLMLENIVYLEFH